MLLPYVVLDVVEAMASLQQSIRDSVSPVVVSAARGAQRLLQPGRLQPAAFSLPPSACSLQPGFEQSLERSAAGQTHVCLTVQLARPTSLIASHSTCS
jgi:hypothetical protein